MKRIARRDFSVNVQVKERNVSLFHEVATNLNQMAESLKQLEAMRQEFISDVSHEIQSPLTSISGFARALHDKNLDGEKRDEYLDIIEAESGRLSRLSDKLLKLSSLDSRTQPVEPRS
jgi:signal transduction histidine kinase